MLFLSVLGSMHGATIKKAFLYDKYTLKDSYPYKSGERRFQWEKINVFLDSLDSACQRYIVYGVLQNYKNANGIAPVFPGSPKDAFGVLTDTFGIERVQAIPLYEDTDSVALTRYGRDGALVIIEPDTASRSVAPDAAGYLRVTPLSVRKTYKVHEEYLKTIGPVCFSKVICVDVTNQNVATLEKSDSVWLVRSMNPITSGLDHPPFKRSTPVGVFLVLEQITKMYYYKDGTSTIAGFAPWATRFCGGAYLHGVPVNYPSQNIVEYSATLGTTPRSHRCVRNASSHALFIYDWAHPFDTLVLVIN